MEIRGTTAVCFLHNRAMLEGFAATDHAGVAVVGARGTQPDLLHRIRPRPIPYNFVIITYSYFGGRLEGASGKIPEPGDEVRGFGVAQRETDVITLAGVKSGRLAVAVVHRLNGAACT